MEAFAEGFATGLVGTLGVTIDDGDGTNVLPRTTANIVEIETVDGLGVYRYLGTYPIDPALSPYLITWDDTEGTASEDILVSATPPSSAVGPTPGPCRPWVEAEDVDECCDVEFDSSTQVSLEDAADVASEILYELSGRQFTGLCGPLTVRPCRPTCRCWGEGQTVMTPSGQITWLPTEGYWSWWDASERRNSCGCGCDSRIKLEGYPVVAIVQVKIDGSPVAPSEYRLDGNRWLTRMADGDGNRQHWPACQRLDREDDEEGTFSVTYYHGIEPPLLGVRAAAELACEVYKSCAANVDAGDCRLPDGVVTVTRQGVTFDRALFSSWALDPTTRSWRTGLPLVDAFLTAHNPAGLRRRSAVWTPTMTKAGRPLGANP